MISSGHSKVSKIDPELWYSSNKKIQVLSWSSVGIFPAGGGQMVFSGGGGTEGTKAKTTKKSML